MPINEECASCLRADRDSWKQRAESATRDLAACREQVKEAEAQAARLAKRLQQHDLEAHDISTALRAQLTAAEAERDRLAAELAALKAAPPLAAERKYVAMHRNPLCDTAPPAAQSAAPSAPLAAVRSLAHSWRDKATNLREESGRIRRTIKAPTDAEERCQVRAEIYDECATALAALDTPALAAVRKAVEQFDYMREWFEKHGEPYPNAASECASRANELRAIACNDGDLRAACQGLRDIIHDTMTHEQQRLHQAAIDRADAALRALDTATPAAQVVEAADDSAAWRFVEAYVKFQSQPWVSRSWRVSCEKFDLPWEGAGEVSATARALLAAKGGGE